EWSQPVNLGKEINTIENIIGMLKAKSEDVVIENLGSSVNTNYDEYFPIINLKGDRLYFCSYNRQEGYGGEDIYSSELKNKRWEPAKNIGDALNSNSHEATLGVSGDEITLTVFGNYPGSLGNGDIFYYSRTKDGWSKREHYPAPVNSLYFDSDLCFSSDGNAIFFVSDRPVGESYREKDNFSNGLWGGNPDIYIIYKTESGWSDAVNLGSLINSQYAERSPFIHPDGRTLYFSSNGHYGIGGLDVFKTTRLNPDSWTEWSQPVNLGKEINTIENDWGYRISLDGKYAYFSAYNLKDTIKKQDIYRTTLPESLRPNLVATVKGKVIDSDGNPLMAKIKWENLFTGMTVGELSSDPDNGSFFIALPLGMKYGFYADKKGYYPVSKNLDLTGKIDSLITLSDDIVLVPIKDIKEKNISVRINNLFFDYDSSVLLQESFPELNRLVKILMDYPGFKIEVSGYTDNIGSKSYNKKLSYQRARSVLEYLMKNGVGKDLLIAKGYGEENPVVSNETEEGRAKNRRVEIKFMKR
ncbi:OmpA family protein, partial [Bacteroidota bacterium]